MYTYIHYAKVHLHFNRQWNWSIIWKYNYISFSYVCNLYICICLFLILWLIRTWMCVRLVLLTHDSFLLVVTHSWFFRQCSYYLNTRILSNYFLHVEIKRGRVNSRQTKPQPHSACVWPGTKYEIHKKSASAIAMYYARATFVRWVF